jgi:CHAD domain-containing protein
VSTEVEAKFIVPGRPDYDRIHALDRLASYRLGEGTVRTVVDTYLDTADRVLLSAGYACRRRDGVGASLITVKAVAGSGGGIHRREELEVNVPRDADPVAWPASEARDKVLGLIGDEPLEEMVRLGQDRFVRTVADGERLVASCSLDDVCTGAAGSVHQWFELEIELTADGTESDLLAMSGWLRATLGLYPSPRSKFELALDAAESPGHSSSARHVGVPEVTSIFLDAPGRLSAGFPFPELAAMGYKTRRRRQRTDHVVFTDTHDGSFLSKGFSVLYSLTARAWSLLEGEDVRAEAKSADETLPDEWPFSEELHSVSPAAPSIPFLECLLVENEYSISGLSARLIRVRAQQWTFLTPLEESEPKALLRLVVIGPPTGCAYFASLLQERLGCLPVTRPLVETGLALLGRPAPGASLPAEFRVAPGDTVHRALARILGGEAWKMRANVRGALHDLDPEFVHDLRVATRRARSALRLFSRTMDPARGLAVSEDLGWIAGLLGETRDLDVLMGTLDDQLERAATDAGFRSFVRERLHAHRARSLSALVDAMKSDRFPALLRCLESWEAPSGDAAPPAGGDQQAIDFARGRIDKAFGKLARGMDRPPENLSDVELHGLRIQFKRLRYMCEFFKPLLGPDAGALIGSFVVYQDCLGLHQDAATAFLRLSQLKEEAPKELLTESFLVSMGAILQVEREIQMDQREKFLRRWKTAPDLIAQWKRMRNAARSPAGAE